MPRVTSKGQVTIPIDVREQLGLLPGSEVEFEVHGDEVRLRKRAHAAGGGRGWELVRRLRGGATTALTTDEIMALTRGGV